MYPVVIWAVIIVVAAFIVITLLAPATMPSVRFWDLVSIVIGASIIIIAWLVPIICIIGTYLYTRRIHNVLCEIKRDFKQYIEQ